VHRHDPTLLLPVTWAVLYYELSCNRRAEVWHALVNYVLYDAYLQGKSVTYDQARDVLVSLGVGSGSAAIKQRDKDARLCLRALVSPNAFGRLGLFASSKSSSKQAVRIQAQPSQPLILAYDLARQESSSVPYQRLGELSGPGRAARVFFWDADEVDQSLGWLEGEGLVRVIRSASLNQIVWEQDKSAFEVLELMYERSRT
jgi:hypothetical protein